MKKWEDDNRLKSYVNKVLNAKPVIHTRIDFSQREADPSSHASCRSKVDSILYKYYFKQIRQLQEYNLQQYANKLTLRGYEHGLQGLAAQSSSIQNNLLEEIKLLPGEYVVIVGHKQKFTDLFKHLLVKQTTPPNMILAKKQSQNHITPLRDNSINRQKLPKLQKPTSQLKLVKKEIKKSKAYDDIIIADLGGQINAKLMNNLQKVFTQDSNINLQVEQIKLMYQSFEGGRLSSTLINIDIEEICNCVASAIWKCMKIPEDKYEQKFEEEYEQQQISIRESQFSFDATETTGNESVFIDQSLPGVKPTVEVIQNYCKNVMITTKMEREVAILAMIYVEKLQLKGPVEITCFNWQRILFTSLVKYQCNQIIASKIWDDESFENNNFAKVLPQFSTIQINEMEKVYLRIIDYNLYVKQGDYAKQYFILRGYADKKKRSYPLKQLDLQTVMKLQKRVEQVVGKSSFINKSF